MARMKIRQALIAFLAVATVVAVTPTPAYALDDNLTCSDFRTRSYTEGYSTTVIGYCARWNWHPDTSSVTDPKELPDPPSGPGGGVAVPDKDDKHDCAELKRTIEELAPLYDEALAAYFAAMANESKLEQDYAPQQSRTEFARRAWLAARSASETVLNQYLRRNGLPVETVIIKGTPWPKKASEYYIDPDLGYAKAVNAALAAERLATDIYLEQQRASAVHLNAIIAAEEAVDEAYVKLTSILQEVELLQTYANEHC
jgi:hypothetical protein